MTNTIQNVNNFNWLIYINNYEDLRNAEINTYQRAITHWINYGHRERRNCSEIIKKESLRKKIFIITNNFIGGSIKYLDDITNNYKNVDFIYVRDKNELYKQEYNSDDVLFIQHLLSTDLLVDELIQIKTTFNLKMYISIHDFYWINENILYTFTLDCSVHNNYLKNNVNINKEILNLFKCADIVIHPSQFTFDIYSKYFDTSNFRLVYHNDYMTKYDIINVPKINNDIINIGMLSTYIPCKGCEFVDLLRKKYTNYKNYKINWFIVGVTIPPYKEIEFYDYVTKYNIHCLTYLNKWGETWCYSLTKGLNTGLPIIYNNFGVFKERIPKNKENYFLVYENENENENESFDCEKLFAVFEKMIEYIILNNNDKYTPNLMNMDPNINYTEFYNSIFA
jgi:hypothetical protein